MASLISDFILSLKVNENRSPHTLKNYASDLEQFEGFLRKALPSPSAEATLAARATRHDVLRFLETLYEKDYAPSSRHRKIAALQKFFSWLVQNKLCPESPIEHFPRPKLPQRDPHYLHENEFRALLHKPLELGTSLRFVRDRALLSLLISTGIRLSESIQLNTDDLSVKLRQIRLIRKGNKEQRLPLTPGAAYHLGVYLKARYIFMEGKKDGPLFISIRRLRLSPRTVQFALKKYARLCKIPEEKVTPHALRHTFATYCLDSGVDIVAVREFLGHKSVKTTERYLHITPEYLKKALEKVPLF